MYNTLGEPTQYLNLRGSRSLTKDQADRWTFFPQGLGQIVRI